MYLYVLLGLNNINIMWNIIMDTKVYYMGRMMISFRYLLHCVVSYSVRYIIVL